MIVKWGDILDSRANYSYVAQVNICKNSEFFKYNITYPVLKLYDKYVYHDMYDREIIININNEICEDVMEFKNSVKKQAIAYRSYIQKNCQNLMKTMSNINMKFI